MFKNYEELPLFLNAETVTRVSMVSAERRAVWVRWRKPPDQVVKTPQKAKLEPKQPKIRRPETGCVTMINDHLWEGSFYPRLPNGKRKKFNVYAESRDQCETKLAEMISEKKAEIAEEKAKLKEGAD